MSESTDMRTGAVVVSQGKKPPVFIESAERMNGEKGKTRIMYIEDKSGGLVGPARIGRVSFSKSGRTLYYRGLKFQSLKGGYKSNYYDVESGAEYWISGPKRNGQDGLYGAGGAEIDANCRSEYWSAVRGQPERAKESAS
jgi:hypothetical protein